MRRRCISIAISLFIAAAGHASRADDAASSDWRATAMAKEQAGDAEGALAAWRELAATHSDIVTPAFLESAALALPALCAWQAAVPPTPEQEAAVVALGETGRPHAERFARYWLPTLDRRLQNGDGPRLRGAMKKAWRLAAKNAFRRILNEDQFPNKEASADRSEGWDDIAAMLHKARRYYEFGDVAVMDACLELKPVIARIECLRRAAGVQRFDGEAALLERARVWSPAAAEREKHAAAFAAIDAATGLSDDERGILRFVNEHRLFLGCEPLAVNACLNQAARGHSDDMKANGFFEHKSKTPGRETSTKRVQAAGYTPSMVGEVLAEGMTEPVDALQGWLESAGHHRTILNLRFTEFGAGVAGSYWTVNLAAPAPGGKK